MVYMKGATAVPEVKKSIAPKKIKIIIIGSSQNFFLTFKKLYISIRKFIRLKLILKVLFIVFFLNAPI